MKTPRYNPACYLAAHGYCENDDPMPPCEGCLVRCHIITQQELRKRHLDLAGDPRTYVMGCGGLTGATGHHGMLDYTKKLRLPLDAIPRETLNFADEYGLRAWLERTYR